MQSSLLKTAAALLAAMSLVFSPVSMAAVTNIHFLIPGGAGGGWDGTARGVGEALTKSELVKKASYQNLSGGGGGVAIARLIKTSNSRKTKRTLMVNSTPIIVRSLSKVFPQSFRDLVPVAGIIADYQALVVRNDSHYNAWQQVASDFLRDPQSVKIAGGSSAGSLDHIAVALAFQAAGGDPTRVVYVPYDAGGKAMAALLAGETALLSTGLGEALELQRAGTVRILAMTGSDRISDAPDVPTLKEQGYDVEFANWRGFFAAPGTPAAKVAEYNSLLQQMYATPEWETVRSRNGWANNYVAGPDEFYSFLEGQEENHRLFVETTGLLIIRPALFDCEKEGFRPSFFIVPHSNDC